MCVYVYVYGYGYNHAWGAPHPAVVRQHPASGRGANGQTNMTRTIMCVYDHLQGANNQTNMTRTIICVHYHSQGAND